MNRPILTMESAALKRIIEYPFPGNIRELENMMYRLSALYSQSIIGKDSFLAEIRAGRNAMLLQQRHVFFGQ